MKHPPNYEHIDENMVKVEVNLDDATGELLGYVMDLLFEAGANDVYYSPIYMKKNRPGILLQILCSRDRLDLMKDILFKETTTLGIRYFPITVHRMERTFITVETKWGPVRVKQGRWKGDVCQRFPEYDDCVRISKKFHIPLKKVYEEVWRLLPDRNDSKR